MKRPRMRLEQNCKDCVNWILERKTIYDDGSEIATYKAPEGKGNCQILRLDTAPDFGCNSFKHGNHTETTNKSGAPWHHWHYDVCPTCNGRGNPGDAKPCEQCWGTGHVRYYDDGFIGEEKTRLHPNEKVPPPAPEITLKKTESKEGVL